MSKRGRIAQKQREAAQRDQKASAKESAMKAPSGGSKYAQKLKAEGSWTAPGRKR